MKTITILLVSAMVSVPVAAEAGEGGDAAVRCTMTFNLKGWSAFYKKSDGEGLVTCDNGQRSRLLIKVRGGGLTFGKSEIVEGRGEFSPVRSIDEVFGSYVAAEAHAGAVRSASAAVYTKGEVSLAVAGTGRGVDLGFAFGKMIIKRRR